MWNVSFNFLTLDYIRRAEGDRASQEGRNSTVTDRGGSGQKDPKLRGGTAKWTQRLEESPVHINSNPGAGKDI